MLADEDLVIADGMALLEPAVKVRGDPFDQRGAARAHAVVDILEGVAPSWPLARREVPGQRLLVDGKDVDRKAPVLVDLLAAVRP